MRCPDPRSRRGGRGAHCPVHKEIHLMLWAFSQHTHVVLEMVLDRKSDPGSGRKKSIVMTQTDSKTPRADQFQGDREEVHVASGDTMNSPKRLARIAGVLYLLVAAIGASILCVNTVSEIEGLRAATGAVNLAAFATLPSAIAEI